MFRGVCSTVLFRHRVIKTCHVTVTDRLQENGNTINSSIPALLPPPLLPVPFPATPPLPPSVTTAPPRHHLRFFFFTCLLALGTRALRPNVLRLFAAELGLVGVGVVLVGVEPFPDVGDVLLLPSPRDCDVCSTPTPSSPMPLFLSLALSSLLRRLENKGWPYTALVRPNKIIVHPFKDNTWRGYTYEGK